MTLIITRVSGPFDVSWAGCDDDSIGLIKTIENNGGVLYATAILRLALREPACWARSADFEKRSEMSFWQKKRVAVTGGAGVSGSFVVE